MKKFTVGGKEYTMEFTIGASLYDDCVVSITQLMTSAFYSESSGLDDKDRIKELLATMGGVPRVALNCLYAGLLEHHGVGEYAGEDSDGSVPDMLAARRVAKNYILENKESGNGSFMDILNLCTECMGDDDFLSLIGLDKMMEAGTPDTPTKKSGRKKTTEK